MIGQFLRWRKVVPKNMLKVNSSYYIFFCIRSDVTDTPAPYISSIRHLTISKDKIIAGTSYTSYTWYFGWYNILRLPKMIARYNLCKYSVNTNRPHRPQTRRGMVFLQILYIFSIKTAIFGQFDNFRSGVFDRNGQKAHLRTKTFHLSL